jgi:hypothetical protein
LPQTTKQDAAIVIKKVKQALDQKAAVSGSGQAGDVAIFGPAVFPEDGRGASELLVAALGRSWEA